MSKTITFTAYDTIKARYMLPALKALDLKLISTTLTGSFILQDKSQRDYVGRSVYLENQPFVYLGSTWIRLENTERYKFPDKQQARRLKHKAKIEIKCKQ